MINIENLTKSFKEQLILDDISFKLEKGKFTSIIGPSGCGKSTIFKIILGLEKKTSGKISIKENNIGYLSQKYTLLPWLTVEENITLPIKLKKNKVNEDKLLKDLELFKINNIRKKYPHEISGGETQRASLLRALYMGGDMLLLDEPFAALDMLTKRELYKWLSNIVKEKKLTVLYITHDIEEAINLSDNILVFKNKPTNILKNIIITNNRKDPSYIHKIKNQIYKLCKH